MSLPNPTSREKQAIATKAKIIRCGKKMIKENGFDKVSVVEISKSAGITVGTFYYYFESKDDLLLEMLPKVTNYFNTKEAIALDKANSYEKIISYISYFSKQRYQKYSDISGRVLSSDNAIPLIDKDRLEPAISIITEGQVAGEFTKDYSSKYIAEVLFYANRGLYQHWLRDQSSYDLFETICDLIKRLAFTFLTKEFQTKINNNFNS